MKGISCPPYAPVLMESTRALGYTLESAIADLMDNCIAARCTTIEIEFWPKGDPYVYIIDDGEGMSEARLTDAMRYGSTSPTENRDEHDLGRFGLGMKTASLSQCRNLTVVSLNNGKTAARAWDLDVVLKEKDWILLCLDEDEINTLPGIQKLRTQGKGTLVIWRGLDRLGIGTVSMEKVLASKMDRVREHISLVFHRYITGEAGIKKLSISINGSAISPHDPFLIAKSEQCMDIEVLTIDRQRVAITPYVLPHTSRLTPDELNALGGEEGLRRRQGFYIYRNKRLLVWGTWFRLLRQDELFKLARIKVDIPNSLDSLWGLDIKKSAAVPPEVVMQSLVRIVRKIAEGSKRTWTFRGKKETDDNLYHVWDRVKTRGGVRYRLNRDYPIIDEVRQRLGTPDRRLFDHMAGLIEDSFPKYSFYADMTNDEPMVHENGSSALEVKDMLILMFANIKDLYKRKELVNLLENTEPFYQHKGILNELANGGCTNEQ